MGDDSGNGTEIHSPCFAVVKRAGSWQVIQRWVGDKALPGEHILVEMARRFLWAPLHADDMLLIVGVPSKLASSVVDL